MVAALLHDSMENGKGKPDVVEHFILSDTVFKHVIPKTKVLLFMSSSQDIKILEMRKLGKLRENSERCNSLTTI